ncbi:uncharacterized protein [Palaemon carinicauda]|uniref:uncharacterized protein n=1 Tax=Palaemon carinicauda TaxID=392227 RepID=UPI0035B5B40F
MTGKIQWIWCARRRKVVVEQRGASISLKKQRYSRTKKYDRHREQRNGTEKRKKILGEKTGIAIGRAVQQLNGRLGTKEREKDIYKISNLRKRQRQDLVPQVVIRDRDKNILHRDDDIEIRWREYYEQLLNTGNEKEELGRASDGGKEYRSEVSIE